MEDELASARGLAPLIPAGCGPGLYLAAGPAALPAWTLSHICPVLARGARVFWVDAANSFAAYGAGRTARASGCDPRAVLDRIRLARPFNAHQLAALLTRTLPPLWRGEPVIVSDPFPMLFDTELPQREARRAFDALLDSTAALPAVWLLLAVRTEDSLLHGPCRSLAAGAARRDAPAGRRGWFAELAGRARRSAVLRPEGAGWRLARG